MKLLLGIILSIFITVVFMNFWNNPNAHESFKEKTEWSILQTVEYNNRENEIPTPMFRTIDKYDLIGMRGHSGKNVWILLNPLAPPYYKQMPGSVNYEITKELFDELRKGNRLGYTTEIVLNSRVAIKSAQQ